jgi:SAM-dependent methyltransferase
MSLGGRVRRAFGPLEPRVAALYRRAFFDITPFAADVAGRRRPARVLEVGCGEGAVLTELAARWPDAHFVGIDPSPAVGRLFRGDTARVVFRHATADEEAARAEPYDVVLMCDVLHHVRTAERSAVLAAVRSLVAPDGLFVLKDWERRANLGHALGAFSDRYLTGDRHVEYLTAGEARALLANVFGRPADAEQRWPPWPNNYSIAVDLRAGDARALAPTPLAGADRG